MYIGGGGGGGIYINYINIFLFCPSCMRDTGVNFQRRTPAAQRTVSLHSTFFAMSLPFSPGPLQSHCGNNHLIVLPCSSMGASVARTFQHALAACSDSYPGTARPYGSACLFNRKWRCSILCTTLCGLEPFSASGPLRAHSA